DEKLLSTQLVHDKKDNDVDATVKDGECTLEQFNKNKSSAKIFDWIPIRNAVWDYTINGN
ncbi:9526_t:CDS:2, partial [Entrophospora sp. SA101]